MRLLKQRLLLSGLASVAVAGLTLLFCRAWLVDRPRELWADIPVPEPHQFWGWLAEENKRLRGETRRPSWGALKAQGAKATVRENLRSDRRYLISSTELGGFTNQFMSVVNGPGIDLAISDLFDLSRLSMHLGGMSIVEMHELWHYDGEQDRHKVVSFDGEFEQVDELGRPLVPGDLIPAGPEPAGRETFACWSWSLNHGRNVENLWRFDDVHWVPIPHSVYAEGDVTEGGSDLAKLSRFARNANDVPQESFQILDKLNLSHPLLLPDPSLFCLDVIYWYAEQPRRWDLQTEWREGSGGWATVGRHMRFQAGLVRLADDYLRHAFGVRPDQGLQPFFAVHIRRGDFPLGWLETTTADHYAHAAWEALREIEDVLGIHIEHIIFTTDERDPEWRAPLLSYGWHVVDHDIVGTSSKFGHWLPTVLDSVILSRATGFLGTQYSTMSIVAMRRVVDWNGGFGRWINYGHSIPENWVWTW